MTGKIIVKNLNKNPFRKVANPLDIEAEANDPNYIHVWTDGGGNCGPISLGVVVVDKDILQLTHGEYLGEGTNSIAELTAILRGLQLVKRRGKPVKIYSDSNYALHSIAGTYNGQKNRELIDKIINYVNSYPVEIIFVKVPGHDGYVYNEFADSIASNMLQHATEKLNVRRKKKKYAKRTSNVTRSGSID